MTSGLLVFKKLDEALKAGFQVYDRTANGYLVRRHSPLGWQIALVDCTSA